MNNPEPTKPRRAAVVATPESVTSRFLNAARNTTALTPQIELDEVGKIKAVRWLEDWQLDELWGPCARRFASERRR
jgi:hypothetical protein